ncbi:hypothetical protein DM473_05155 [Lactobacillus helveticus]|nr:hypothetical protein BCM44_07605 [Lactobacillus helveticus]AZA22569.1 MAG: hypothetical protein DQL94_03195 [Lactobacillus helveticus]MCS8611964.1 hypothetical protein [Lactobacillus helveticus]MCT3401274.1 hypothetical protein [Lactobacillus helveticus]MCT3411301.1 hypothetical protein [Lactobacillus helveticus]
MASYGRKFIKFHIGYLSAIFGHVLGLKNIVSSYEGKNVKELESDFKAGIDDYLENCNYPDLKLKCNAKC